MRKVTITKKDWDKAVSLCKDPDYTIGNSCVASVAAAREWKAVVSTNRNSISVYKKNPNKVIKDRIFYYPISSNAQSFRDLVDGFDSTLYRPSNSVRNMLPLTFTFQRSKEDES